MKAARALRVATEADAPTERKMIEARLRAHIEQHDQLSADLAQSKALIADESRRLANLNGLTMRPTLGQLRMQLGITA